MDGSIGEEQIDLNNFPSLYGKSKWEVEQYLRNEAGEKNKIISLRPRAVYGKNDRIMLPRILAIGKSGKIRLPGDGKVKLSMTHISNLIAAIDLAIASDQQGFHYYNVADENPYELRKIFSTLISGVAGKEITFQFIPENLVKAIISMTTILGRPFPLTWQAFEYITRPTIINIEKIKAELDYQPRTEFYQEAPQIIEWAKQVGQEIIENKKQFLPWIHCD